MARILGSVLLFFVFLTSCIQEEDDQQPLVLQSVTVGDRELAQDDGNNVDLPLDRPITLRFSVAIDPQSVQEGIQLRAGGDDVPFTTSFFATNTQVVLFPTGQLANNTSYTVAVTDRLQSTNGARMSPFEVTFRTLVGSLQATLDIPGARRNRGGRLVEVPLEGLLQLTFNHPVDRNTLLEATTIEGDELVSWDAHYTENDRIVTIRLSGPFRDFSRYRLSVSNTLVGAGGETFAGLDQVFYTAFSDEPKFPVISDESLLDLVQERTFRYFYDFAHEASGMARERNTSGNLVTTGGSGFGVMALLVGMERGFIDRASGVRQLQKITDFLASADRFHGVWPHWLNGNTGTVIPFSDLDDGGDLVETALLMQGLLAASAYLSPSVSEEATIRDKITRLWEEVEWDWYTRGGQSRLFWHWSPNVGWSMNLPVSGYNEALITYILAAASPTHPISKEVYDQGWARGGDMRNGKSFFGVSLPLGEDFGGPLFFSHYSFLAIDPRNLSDQYADYWEQSVAHTSINRLYCIDNPRGWVGYGDSLWGLTASDNHQGYSAHSPLNDLGVITPSAALSSMPYTPEESMEVLRTLYYRLGDRMFGEFGFYDALNPTEQWFADSYLAIDQGPILLMIENYRTGFIWSLLKEDETIKRGLERLGFSY